MSASSRPAVLNVHILTVNLIYLFTHKCATTTRALTLYYKKIIYSTSFRCRPIADKPLCLLFKICGQKKS